MTTWGEAQELLPNTCLTEHGVLDRWDAKVLLVAESPTQMGDSQATASDLAIQKDRHLLAP